ncbi:hypothetical protein [Salarchaeum japonicum]|uniref:hypothetical protein n=1 Tax=Salarchaeum japonicum TaxID=555573 RepID=UPI003C75EFC5
MNLDIGVFKDELDVLGVVVGVLVALMGVGTLVGMPWQYANSVVVTVGQIVGALSAIVIGLGLAYFVHTTA